jgi:hypothetical protein
MAVASLLVYFDLHLYFQKQRKVSLYLELDFFMTMIAGNVLYERGTHEIQMQQLYKHARMS